MAVYAVVLEVDGIANVILEAESEEDACRAARHRAEMGNADSLSLDYVAVRVEEVQP